MHHYATGKSNYDETHIDIKYNMSPRDGFKSN
jgi:hypothetical protein